MERKKGISMVVLITTITIMLILITTATIAGTTTANNSKKIAKNVKIMLTIYISGIIIILTKFETGFRVHCSKTYQRG